MNTNASAHVSSSWRDFFLVAALYDLLLGAAFVVFGEQLLNAIGMELPPTSPTSSWPRSSSSSRA